MNWVQIYFTVVGGLRYFAVYLAFKHDKKLTERHWDPKLHIDKLTARLFGYWTLLSGSLALLYAYEPTESLAFANMISFVIALGVYINESIIHKNVPIMNAIIPFVTATSSILVLLFS